MAILLILLIVAGGIFYLLKPEERAPLVREARVRLEQARDAARESLRRRWERGTDEDAAAPRTPVAWVTWLLVVTSAWTFLRMLASPGSLADPDVLVGWGGSFGPYTSNGEWWRLVTTMFVHVGPLHLLSSLAGLIYGGRIVERTLGHTAFGAVYFAAGIFSGVVGIAASAIDVHTGAAGGILGVYGFLAGAMIWGLLRGPRVTVPLAVIKQASPGIGLFLLYSIFTERLDGAAEIAALATGLASGFLLTRGTDEAHRPALRRIAGVAAATVLMAVAFAVPLRGIADVRPELRQLFELEERTAAAYKKEVARFTNGRAPATVLVGLIERTILPELTASEARLASLARVPREHQPVVAAARKYLELRTESWRQRSRGLRRSSMPMLQTAERTEWQALGELEKIRTFR